MDSSTIQMACCHCGKLVTKDAAKTLKRLQQGQKNFFCSRSCSTINFSSKYSYTKGNSPSKHDEYSIFRYHLRNMRQRCQDKNIEFSITLDDLKDLWEKQNGFCAVTKLELTAKVYKDKRLNDPYQASPDRIDNSKGYTKDNVRWVCLMFNYARNTFSDDQVLQFLSDASKSISEQYV
jgi:hypothetical protein